MVVTGSLRPLALAEAGILVTQLSQFTMVKIAEELGFFFHLLYCTVNFEFDASRYTVTACGSYLILERSVHQNVKITTKLLVL